MTEMAYQCIGGGQVDNDGVCVEHGETACVIGVRVPSTQLEDPRHSDDSERDESSSTSGPRLR